METRFILIVVSPLLFFSDHVVHSVTTTRIWMYLFMYLLLQSSIELWTRRGSWGIRWFRYMSIRGKSVSAGNYLSKRAQEQTNRYVKLNCYRNAEEWKMNGVRMKEKWDYCSTVPIVFQYSLVSCLPLMRTWRYSRSGNVSPRDSKVEQQHR